MDVTVTMSEYEFMAFMKWKSDKNYYNSKMDCIAREKRNLADQICRAVDYDIEHPGMSKIIDQVQAKKLLEMARECF